MATAPVFRLFGFPVRVRSGFLVFLLLVVGMNGTSFGMWLALSIAGFTLLHELGHAFAARATGARAEISLDFMAGYAAFVPTRPLSRLERAGISFAGPGAQILVGLGVFAIVNGGLSWPTADEHLQIAVLWAGPAIGIFNLIPILPFDGGNILEQVIGAFAPNRARSIMVGITLAVVGAGVAFAITHPPLRPYIIFMLVPLLSVVQVTGARRGDASVAERERLIARAESLAWATGDVSTFPPGCGPSPWFRAHQQLVQGSPDLARQVLLDDLAGREGTLVWVPPTGAPVEALHRLLFLLHDPLPEPTAATPALSSAVLADVLLRVGSAERAGQYAANAYPVRRDPTLAIIVARAAVALDDVDTAYAWLRAAAAAMHPLLFRTVLDHAPEFARLHGDPAFERIRSAGQ